MVIAATPTFRTDAFIDGAFRPAQSGARFVTENPATGRPLAEVAAGDAADIDLAVQGGAAGVRRRALVAPLPGRPEGRAPPLRRPARGEPRGAGHARFARGRQADHRLPRRRPPGHGPDLPLVRGGDRQAVRRRRADRARRRGPDPARADRRRRGGRALELPDPDGGLEGRPGPRRRQLDDRQALAADLVVGDPDGRARRRGRPAGRRPQRRAGSGCGSGCRARAGTWTSTRSRSPARPRSAGCSSSTLPRATSRK